MILLQIFRPGVWKTLPEEFAEQLVHIGCLCEQALRSRLTLRKEGQVELQGETPNGLSASATLPKGDRGCQYYFCELPLPTTAALQTVAMLAASAIQGAGSAW